MKNIAVCFAGEPRTYDIMSDSIKAFFHNENHNVKYFCHTWNTNSYKMISSDTVFEEYSIEFIENDIKTYFDFEKLMVEKQFPTVKRDFNHQLYSEAACNLLKRQYELENSMTFDVVVKCRFDLAFFPGITFNDILPNEITEKTIYSNNEIKNSEGYVPSLDDIFYYGTSYSMDTVNSSIYFVGQDIHRNLQRYKDVDKNTNANHFIGPGIRIWQWQSQNNILPQNIDRHWFIYRKFLYPQVVTSENYHSLLGETLKVYANEI